MAVARTAGTAGRPVVVARIRAPVFSVKHPEAYQSYTAVPLPLPSTLVGALGRAIAMKGWCRGSAQCYEEALRLAPVARPLKPDDAVAVSGVVYRVRKVLEASSSDSKGDWPSLYIDRRVREYSVISSYIYALYVPARGQEKRVAHLVSTIERVGDSESYVVVEAVVAEAESPEVDPKELRDGLCFDVALVAQLKPGTPGKAAGLGLQMVEPGVYMTIIPRGCEDSHLAKADPAAYLLPLRPASSLTGTTAQVYEPSCIKVKHSALLKPCLVRAWGRRFTIPCSMLSQDRGAGRGAGCLL